MKCSARSDGRFVATVYGGNWPTDAVPPASTLSHDYSSMVLRNTSRSADRVAASTLPMCLTSRALSSAHLFGQDQALLATEADGNAERCRMATGGHGSDQHGAQPVMNFGRRDDHAGACLLDFGTHGGIERGQPDVAPLHLHHFKSTSPALANSGQTGTSAPCAAISRAASAQPTRGR